MDASSRLLELGSDTSVALQILINRVWDRVCDRVLPVIFPTAQSYLGHALPIRWENDVLVIGTCREFDAIVLNRDKNAKIVLAAVRDELSADLVPGELRGTGPDRTINRVTFEQSDTVKANPRTFEFVVGTVSQAVKVENPDPPKPKPLVASIKPETNRHYTFARYIAQTPMKMAAVRAARLFAGEIEADEDQPNILVIEGPVASGKTTLCHCIVKAFWDLRDPEAPCDIVLMTGEDFVHDFGWACGMRDKDKRNEAILHFDRRVQRPRLLVIDGVDFISARPGSSGALLRAIDQVTGYGNLLVVTTNIPIRRLWSVDPNVPGVAQDAVGNSIRSRLGSGIMIVLDPPTPSEITEIGLRFAQSRERAVSEEAIRYFARVAADARQLQGMINTADNIARACPMDGKVVPFDASCVEGVARRFCGDGQKPKAQKLYSLSTVADTVIAVLVEQYSGGFTRGVKLTDPLLRGKVRRDAKTAHLRDFAVFLTHDIMNGAASLKAVGDQFGGRDHTTIARSIKNVTDNEARMGIAMGIREKVLRRLEGGTAANPSLPFDDNGKGG